jgi:ubiquinone/menaquinone biosynthesis C-methylase UbiE
MPAIRPAALAFDAVAPAFDDRFSAWHSVAAQRRAVRQISLRVYPPGGRIFEIGGGTGDDAAWLARRGFEPFFTDASPTMVRIARTKLSPLGIAAEVAAAEELDLFAEHYLATGCALFDGAFSNFAPLNCVDDLSPMARGLARLLKPSAPAMLVLFGTLSPGEMLVECMRGRPRRAFRRLQRGPVPAQIGGRDFMVRYHRGRAIETVMQPWFRFVRRFGIGVVVPPSAAEPWISRHRALLGILEVVDRFANRPLATFGDHILYHFERTDVKAP